MHSSAMSGSKSRSRPISPRQQSSSSSPPTATLLQTGESSRRRQSWMSGASAAGSAGSAKSDARLRMIIKQRRESQALRELSDFLRSEAPPPSNNMSKEDDDDDNDDTPSVASLSASARKKKKKLKKLWDLKSVLMGRKADMNKGKKAQRPRHEMKLPDSVVAGRTTAGHRHIAISIPVQFSHLGPDVKSQYPTIEPKKRALLQPSSHHAAEPLTQQQPELSEHPGDLNTRVLRPLVEVRDESDEDPTQDEDADSFRTPRPALPLQPEDLFPDELPEVENDGGLRPQPSLDSVAKSNSPLGELFVTAPNSLKSAPTSPFDHSFIAEIICGNQRPTPKHAQRSFASSRAYDEPCTDSRENRSNAPGADDALVGPSDAVELGQAAPSPRRAESPAPNQPVRRRSLKPKTALQIALDTSPPGTFEDMGDGVEPDALSSHADEQRLRHVNHDIGNISAKNDLFPDTPTSQVTIRPQETSDSTGLRPISSVDISPTEGEVTMDASFAMFSSPGSSSITAKSLDSMQADKNPTSLETGDLFEKEGRDRIILADEGVPARREFQLLPRTNPASQALHPAQSTTTPWSPSSDAADDDYSPPRSEGDETEPWLARSGILPSVRDNKARSPMMMMPVQNELTPPGSPPDDESQQDAMSEARGLRPRPAQVQNLAADRAASPQPDRISLMRRIERRKKLAAAAVGARQARLFASIAESEAASEQRETSRRKHSSLPYPPTSRPGTSMSSTGSSATSDLRVEEMERRLKLLEQNGEAWLGALMPLLNSLSKTLEGQQVLQQHQHQQQQQHHRGRPSTSIGVSSIASWSHTNAGGQDGSAEGPQISRFHSQRRRLQIYDDENDDEDGDEDGRYKNKRNENEEVQDDNLDQEFFLTRRQRTTIAARRPYRVITPMEDEDGVEQAAAQARHLREARRRSLDGSAAARKASCTSQDLEDALNVPRTRRADVRPTRRLRDNDDDDADGRGRGGVEAGWSRHQRFPSTSTMATMSSFGLPRPQSSRSQKSSRRVSFASADLDRSSREEKRRRDTQPNLFRKPEDLFGLGPLMDELRDAARLSREFLPERDEGEEDEYGDLW